MNNEDEELTREEEDRLKKTWRRWCRDSTRPQIVQTMADNRDLSNEVYSACHEELLARDRADDKRAHTAESRRVWAAATPKQQARMIKRRKLKSWVKSINF